MARKRKQKPVKLPKKPKPPIKRLNTHIEVAEVTTDNPYYYGGHEDGQAKKKRITALCNVRENPAAWMAVHNQISEAQLAAALKYRIVWENAQDGNLRAIDTTKEPTSGGGGADYSPSERRFKAIKEMAQLKIRLGAAGYELMNHVCGHCRFISDHYATTRRQQNVATKHLRECLDTLIIYWDMGALDNRIRRRAS